ncbi:aminopeptidase N [Rubellimicrobium sp. CFH 75288]|uniref:aminopeptidase N n=1 Tax=Rubellimicrobium sp. CFH 75288 TaxID=2697034 RepID=UPI001413708B|nr:aminopeptidase N [Rubellimicrobium sp. CFH 75288]NAZ35371.1 aminopeptidase N [Rubellimicrobium sp. CFH 75288]
MSAEAKAARPTVRLSDYRPFPWRIERTDLAFVLAPRATRVRARLRLAPREGAPPGPFVLHGEDLRLLEARIDGRPVSPVLTPEGLTCDVPPGPFTWEATVEIDPAANTRLEGLYLSNGIFCTQCEAEGFRRITFYPDRPDVLAPFRVRIESDLPVLLSNGNPVARGEGWAEWDDPFPKPSYLFALVAGELVAHRDRFTTRSGREVALAVWVRPGDEGRCAWAMEALKAAMRWDEEEYGLEYDLSEFNIVAVDDFNMGAMENKGLNIFNSALVLASPETATDGDYESIERVVAHEYFHNWTGNRVTCRDWFQLSLKEGLTVFRDQQFMGDRRGRGLKRIGDAILLRARQFREDAGPLAHPVRPEEFEEINNFYTVTVYEKGAEVIGMLRRLVGEEGYRRAVDLYLRRHDGEAATVEDWLKAFEDATGRDLGQFGLWYSQAGTPRLRAEEAWEDGTYSLTLSQTVPPTPGQPDKAPMVIPVAVGLLGPNGQEVAPTRVLELTEARQTFRWEGLGARPVPSILRGFSAPVILERDAPPERLAEEAAFLLAHDTDEFNRWEAGQTLARAALLGALAGEEPAPSWTGALDAALGDRRLAPGYRAFLLRLPSEEETAQAVHERGEPVDPGAIHAAHESVRDRLAHALASRLQALWDEARIDVPYDPSPEQAGRRALAHAALGLLVRVEGPERAAAHFASADNMTQSVAALSTLLSVGAGEAEAAAFFERWKGERLVLDKWFALQIAQARPEAAVPTAERLTRHPLFDWKNPNRFRAVFGALAGNPAGFHNPTGAGYALLADWLLRLDRVNPQTAARMSTAFDTWRRLEPGRRTLAERTLRRIAAAEGLSRDLGEMTARMLA